MGGARLYLAAVAGAPSGGHQRCSLRGARTAAAALCGEGFSQPPETHPSGSSSTYREHPEKQRLSPARPPTQRRSRPRPRLPRPAPGRKGRERRWRRRGLPAPGPVGVGRVTLCAGPRPAALPASRDPAPLPSPLPGTPPRCPGHRPAALPASRDTAPLPSPLPSPLPGTPPRCPGHRLASGSREQNWAGMPALGFPRPEIFPRPLLRPALAGTPGRPGYNAQCRGPSAAHAEHRCSLTQGGREGGADAAADGTERTVAPDPTQIADSPRLTLGAGYSMPAPRPGSKRKTAGKWDKGCLAPAREAASGKCCQDRAVLAWASHTAREQGAQGRDPSRVLQGDRTREEERRPIAVP
ncbi:translation initiation factor IF-2-like [Corvus kubaryi]|uniref:translation initiation factor IF-2-like n=1 Tax=Corvus kubaryi TaxID=68294 RepID=UPI001C051209|nr:translation initiation factor IF-2-like [Corvus kubaryi]